MYVSHKQLNAEEECVVSLSLGMTTYTQCIRLLLHEETNE